MNRRLLIILSAFIAASVIITAALILTLFLRERGVPDNTPVALGELRVDFIDVGKGDCILIRSGSFTVMIDTGYNDTADDVSGYLDACGVSEIDALILTHYDKDHIGGAKKLLSSYIVKKIYAPDYDSDSKKFRKLMKAVNKNDIPVQYVAGEVSFNADSVTYTVMPSGIEYNPQAGNDNDMSLLVSVVYSEDTYLFTGDIEAPAISRFVDRNRTNYDIIKIPHHGRAENNSKELLDSVRPEYAVITDDYENGMDLSLGRLLDSAGTKYFRTSLNGTITITGNGNGIYKIETEKTANTD